MPGLPRAIFVVDAHKETIALEEAARLGIPVVAIADTNANPDGIDYIIPGNDDSMKSLQLFISTIADACLHGKAKSRDKGDTDDKSAEAAAKTGKFFDGEGNAVSVSKKKSFDK